MVDAAVGAVLGEGVELYVEHRVGHCRQEGGPGLQRRELNCDEVRGWTAARPDELGQAVARWPPGIRGGDGAQADRRHRVVQPSGAEGGRMLLHGRLVTSPCIPPCIQTTDDNADYT